MSRAACAKIIIDNYASYGGAGAEAQATGEASCEALMQLYDDPTLSKSERAEIIKLSAECCEWGDQVRLWNDRIRKFVRTMAEKHITGEPG